VRLRQPHPQHLTEPPVSHFDPYPAVSLNLPYLYPTLPSFREMGRTLVRCPGMPPIRALDMVITMQDKESNQTKVRLYQFKRIPEGSGMLFNSYDWFGAQGPEGAQRRHLACPTGMTTESLLHWAAGQRWEDGREH
jgi:hypothetical protein